MTRRLPAALLAMAVAVPANLAAQTTDLDLDRRIGGNTVRDLYIYPHFQDDYALGDTLPARLRALEIAPGVAMNVADLREKTRLDRTPVFRALARKSADLNISLDYHDRLFDLGDRLIFDREMVITYDPAICTNGEKGWTTLLRRTVCFDTGGKAGAKEEQAAVAELRAGLRKTPKDYTLPDGTSRDAALKLDDGALLGRFMNSGEYRMTAYGEIPTSAYLDRAALRDDVVQSVNRVPGTKRPEIDGATDLTRSLTYQSPPVAAPAPRRNPALRPILPRLPGKTLTPSETAKEKLQRLRWRQMMDDGIDPMARTGIDATRLSDKVLERHGLAMDRSLDLTPEQRRRLQRAFSETLPNTVTDVPGPVANPELNFLTGFTYGRRYSGAVGHVFYRGDRFFDPIFVRLTYWVEPILTLKAPFHGRVSNAKWSFRKHILSDGRAVYYPRSLDFDVSLAGQNVDRGGNTVFNAVGLPGPLRADGHEFKVGLTADATLIYDIPGPDEKRVYFDEIGYALKHDFAPPLSNQRRRMAEANLPWERSGLGVDIAIASAGVDFGIGLFGTNGKLFVSAEGSDPFTLRNTFFDGTTRSMQMVQPSDVNRNVLSARAILDAPRYEVDLEYVPYIRPEVSFGVGRYRWRHDHRIDIDILKIVDRRALGAHDNTDNRNVVTFDVPKPVGE